MALRCENCANSKNNFFVVLVLDRLAIMQYLQKIIQFKQKKIADEEVNKDAANHNLIVIGAGTLMYLHN